MGGNGWELGRLMVRLGAGVGGTDVGGTQGREEPAKVVPEDLGAFE